jgi:Rod binding domain-containing protein
LEEVFLRYLVREMRVGVVRPEVGPTGGGGAGLYDSLIEEGMASALADSGQLGLARMLESAVSGYPSPKTR